MLSYWNKMLLKTVSKFDVKFLYWFLFQLVLQRVESTCLSWRDFLHRDSKLFFFCSFFAFLISNDSLIFRLWYCCSVDKVLGFIQLNCPWHSRQCSVAPELSHFPLKLSYWCSMVLVMTFFLVSPIYRAFQLQSNL